MGRGLSKLQKTILKLVSENAVEAIDTNDFGKNPVTVSEIAAAYYGWVPTDRERIIFDRKNIPGYYAGKVAISKATMRLVARGLIRRTGGGWIASEELLSQLPRWQEMVKVLYHQNITEMPRHESRYMLTWDGAKLLESNG